MKISAIAIIATSLMANKALAGNCDINFNFGVIINPQHVRIIEHNQTIVQINNNLQLFVKGRELDLSSSQRLALSLYSQGIRQQVPEIVSIAIEGVDIGLKTVNKLIASLTGENSLSHQKIQEKFNELQMRLRTRFNHADENYFIAPQDFENFDEIFTGEFEQEIQDIVSQSLGTILVAVGGAISAKENNDFEQNTDSIVQQLENIGEDIKIDVGSKVNQLEQKTQQFCQNLHELDQAEHNLQQAIPQLQAFDLIETNAAR